MRSAKGFRRPAGSQRFQLRLAPACDTAHALVLGGAAVGSVPAGLGQGLTVLAATRLGPKLCLRGHSLPIFCHCMAAGSSVYPQVGLLASCRALFKVGSSLAVLFVLFLA